MHTVRSAWRAGRGPARGESLAPVTIDAAGILGIDGRIGSLEAGKDGDLAFRRQPFEYTTHVIGVVIDGQVSDTVR